MASSDRFTRRTQPPNLGGGINLRSPILEAYATTQNSTRGVITSYTDMGADQFDRCVVDFMGKSIRATCCHPGMSVGTSVCMIEQPIGVWWATILQKSWYSRPLAELAQKGYTYAAAVEWLLSFGPQWRPTLILIDKRGETSGPPWTTPGEIPYLRINPDTGLPYTFGDFDTDGSGGISLAEWPFDPYLFALADANGDGIVTPDEWAAFWEFWQGAPVEVAEWPYEITDWPAGTGQKYIFYRWYEYQFYDPDAEALWATALSTARRLLAASVSRYNAKNIVFYYEKDGKAAWAKSQAIATEYGPVTVRYDEYEHHWYRFWSIGATITISG